ncbi:MAG: SO_0444 family Cu/Zn efflux transporter [Planctomycetes bacterium]|nr:SO_0444 family Cu/Zn efflux transporter [Planctomycetota bacterium]
MSAFLLGAWDTLADAAPYLLAGFLVAALLDGLLVSRALMARLSGARTKSVLLATALGVPLPLCSCSVLPTALALRRKGAGKGATVAFLIATPETSVTSILLTYGLMGPLFAVVRPVAATVTALAAGLLENARERRAPEADAVHGHAKDPTPAGHDASASDAASSACCGDAEHATSARPAGATSSASCCADACDPTLDDDSHRPLGERLRRGLRFAFVDLFDDVFGWLVVGVLAASAIAHWLPASLWTSIPGGSLGSMLAMVVIGVPLYICAEASTPIAAALVAQGLSPGAALVLLLVGPATNLGALGVLRAELGSRSVLGYLGTIVVASVAAGLALDGWLGTSAIALPGGHGHGPGGGLLGQLSAAALLLLGTGTLLRHPWTRRLLGRHRRAVASAH